MLDSCNNPVPNITNEEMPNYASQDKNQIFRHTNDNYQQQIEAEDEEQLPNLVPSHKNDLYPFEV